MESERKKEAKEEKTEAEKARELLDQERQQRLAACEYAIQQALGQFRCTLVALPAINADGRVVATVHLKAEV